MARENIKPEASPSGPYRVAKLLERKDGSKVRHHRHPHVFVLDPDSLKGEDGSDPVLALPKDGGGFVLRQVLASHAADLLACDVITGGDSKARIATLGEVAQWKAEQTAASEESAKLAKAYADARKPKP